MMLPVSTYDNEDPSSTARLINCYAEAQPQGARSPVVLRKCPGLKHWGVNYELAWQGPVGVFARFPTRQDLLYLPVYSNQSGFIYSLNEHAMQSTNTYTDRTVPLETTYVKSDSHINFSAAFFSGEAPRPGRLSHNPTFNYYDFAIVTYANTGNRNAADPAWLDNYLLWREPGTRRFFGSDVGNVTAYTSTNFATKEAAGDLLVGLKATRANLLLFGEETIEIWDAVGGSAFPFRRIINGAIDKGCANSRTIAEIDDQVLWVADDHTVRLLSGMDPTKVSNFAIDRYLQASDSISSGQGFTYTFDGHNYYVLRFPDRCFVFDITTGQWHERQTIGTETWAYGPSEQAWGHTWFARKDNPAIYQSHKVVPVGKMADDCYYELEDIGGLSSLMTDVPMTMSWTYQPVWGAGQRVFHDRLEIVVQTGVGNSDSTDPVVHLEASDDGGQTWSSLPDRAMGAQGKTFQRVVWHNLGSSYQRVYRASVSDAVPVRVMSTELTARGGRV